MDIGTAKPDPQVRARIQHHMIDVADPDEDFSVQQFQQRGRAVLEQVESGAGRIVIVGGSGLHLRCLVDPMTFAPTDVDLRASLEAGDEDVLRADLVALDPRAPEYVDMRNPRRVVRALEVIALTGDTPSARAARPEAMALAAYDPLIPFAGFGIDAGDRSAARVEARLDDMLGRGLLDEVASLAGRLGTTARQALGYKELLPVVEGRSTLEKAATEVLRATRSLVKRQRTFFRRDPRISWLPWQDDRERRVADMVEIIGKEAGWTS